MRGPQAPRSEGSLDACPFCHAELPEHVARFGGKCPSCFGHVPGDEAPTHPGVSERAEAPHPRGRARWVLLGALAVAGAGLVGALGWTLFRPAPVATVLDFDDAGYAVGEMQFVAWVEPAPEPAASPRPRVRRTNPAAEPSDPVPVEEVAVADVAPAPVPEGRGVDAQFGLDVGVSRRASSVRLTDDDAIVEMIKEVLTSESPKLKSCYEQRLKTREDLSGRWMLSLVVGRDGRPHDVAVTGADVADAELEACIVERVRAWSFQPIRADQPIQKTLGFTPGL